MLEFLSNLVFELFVGPGVGFNAEIGVGDELGTTNVAELNGTIVCCGRGARFDNGSVDVCGGEHNGGVGFGL